MIRETLFGCVVVHEFAAQAMLRLRPHLAGGPAVVMEGKRAHEKICSVNTAAWALGLRAGMTRIEVETFGEVTILGRSRQEEEAAERVLLTAAGTFTPRVERRKGTGSAWECILDLTGSERLLGSTKMIGERLSDQMLAVGFTVHLALCANADAGLSFARDAGVGQGRRVYVRVVPSETLVDELAPLSLDVLLLDAEQKERFAVWGVSTLGELAALPEVDLITRMGQPGKLLRLRARGELPYLLIPVEEELTLSEVMEFDDPLETLEPLLFCINPMLERLIVRAQSHASALAAVTISLWLYQNADRELEEMDTPKQEALSLQLPTLIAPATVGPLSAAAPASYRGSAMRTTAPRHPRKELPLVESNDSNLHFARPVALLLSAPVTSIFREAPPPVWPTLPRPESSGEQCLVRTVRPAVPTLNRPLLLKLLQLDLESQLPAGAVMRVELSAEPGESGQIQLGLFTPQMPEPTRFEDTHARLVAIVGEGNVGRVRPLDTHAAEDFALERFKLPGASSKASPPRSGNSRPATALRRLRPAAAVRVVCSYGDRAKISTFFYDGRRFEVLRCFGPWRSSGDWWQPTVWSADTWDLAARAATGQPAAYEEGELLLCVVAHDLVHDRWLLQGIYD